jgi:SAM-dependent methyltransferase
MAHLQQRVFCEKIKARLPQYFMGTMAMDIGSFDINGNNQYLFDTQSLYLGVDVALGRNVDIVCPAYALGLPDSTFDVIVSTECLEHDWHWAETLRNAIRMLRPGGLLLITCATTGRPEHGTRRTTPQDAPLLSTVDDAWADYYRNLTEEDIRAAIDIPDSFQLVEFSIGEETHDLYFFGVKHGFFERRLDRSTCIETHPSKVLETNLRLQIQRAFETLHRTEDDLSKILNMLSYEKNEREKLQNELSICKTHENKLFNALSHEKDNNEKLQIELNICKAHEDELLRMRNSKSWRITHPLRVFMTYTQKAAKFWRRARNALRYIVRGDLNGLRKRLQTIHADNALQNVSMSDFSKRWGIMATPHTLFIAHLIASHLRSCGWTADILTSAPNGFPHDMYVVICAQMFDTLPPGHKRIIYQMEQSVSSRWFTASYLETLDHSMAVLEYALINIEFLADKNIRYPHIHYLPVGADPTYMRHVPAAEKEYDVLFYGDANSSKRRREMLNTLRQHFNVHVCSEVFGENMIAEIRRARVVINLHYYENALLEMPRIQECLSLGVPLVSEASQDQADYPEIAGAVTFFEQGNDHAMIEAVRNALMHSVTNDVVFEAAGRGAERFAFMFDRFLVAMNFLPPKKLVNDCLPLPNNASRIALSMPETIARRRIFEENRPLNCTVFDGIRFRPGWVGCGLSYANLARHALRHNLHRLTIFEDDALLPVDFEEKMTIVHAYLDTKEGQWDVFAGVIASLHPEMDVLEVEDFQGMRFVTIDKMTSMVCNIYSEKALCLLASWNETHLDDQTNTIDRYLERQANLRIVIALPFLVGHREEVASTLWGFQNTQYRDLIANSEQALQTAVKKVTTIHTEVEKLSTASLNN